MPEGTLCNRKPIQTEQDLKTLLSDTGGKAYYQQMRDLDVDSAKLWATIQKSFKSRLRTVVFYTVSMTGTPNRCPLTKSSPPWARLSAAKDASTTIS